MERFSDECEESSDSLNPIMAKVLMEQNYHGIRMPGRMSSAGLTFPCINREAFIRLRLNPLQLTTGMKGKENRAVAGPSSTGLQEWV